MKKLDALRAHLLESVPDLAANPDKLLTFVDNGRIAWQRGQHLSHGYTLQAQIIITDYSGDVDAVIIPLLDWMNRFEPSPPPDEAVALEAEIIDNQHYDLALNVRLTERVVAKVDCDEGTIKAEHRMPEYPIEACPATHWQLYVRDTDIGEDYNLISEWDS
jgi:hypothetical protein